MLILLSPSNTHSLIKKLELQNQKLIQKFFDQRVYGYSEL